MVQIRAQICTTHVQEDYFYSYSHLQLLYLPTNSENRSGASSSSRASCSSFFCYEYVVYILLLPRMLKAYCFSKFVRKKQWPILNIHPISFFPFHFIPFLFHLFSSFPSGYSKFAILVKGCLVNQASSFIPNFVPSLNIFWLSYSTFFNRTLSFFTGPSRSRIVIPIMIWRNGCRGPSFQTRVWF